MLLVVKRVDELAALLDVELDVDTDLGQRALHHLADIHRILVRAEHQQFPVAHFRV